MAKLPVIDFSKEDCLKPGISSWLSICNDVCLALEELGCFEAIMPNDVYSELQNIFAAVKDFFDAPSELKPKNRYEGNPYCGHFTYNIVMKVWGLITLQTLKKLRSSHNSFGLRETTNFDVYANVMRKPDQAVTRMVFENYGVEKYMTITFNGLLTSYSLQNTKNPRWLELMRGQFGVKTEYDPAIIESTRREMMNQDSIGLFAMKVGETNTLEELVDEDIKQ
ncbi:hypothetical protein C1H46_019257 [Malus baccata]|uniref:Non-haem dioxygenase N-terminal domain-containing protein n=1 Tax=Malus baccata TaxID=106549 RepID=A0A540M8U4_MALBA|nr:hypothetical protein C1H46_019257 [Malus baccata]